MTDFLHIPSPRGNAAVLEQSAHDLRRTGREVLVQRTGLATNGRQILDAWYGVGSLAFESQERRAEQALVTIADAHFDAAAALDHYRDEFWSTEAIAKRAVGDVRTAIHDYGQRARREIDQLIAHIRRFIEDALDTGNDLIDGAIDGVADLAGDVLAAGRGLLDKLLSWQPPQQNPKLDLCDVPPPSHHFDVGSVLDHVRHGLGWGISPLLDGAGWLVERIGGLLAGAVAMFRRVEEAFANAVSRALRLARNAVQSLWELGKRVASQLAQLAVSLGKVLFELASKTVDYLVDAAEAYVRGVLKQMYFLYESARLLIGLAVLSHKKLNGQIIDFRRRGNDAMDDEWTSKFLKGDRAWQIRADEQRLLSNHVYDNGAPLPKGWRRLESREGPEGFFAAIYMNDKGEIVVSFRGSEPRADALNDWSQDVQNAAGLPTEQGLAAIAYAKYVKEQYPGASISFTGHSLGGSLAAIASITTGDPASTFNAAGVGDGNYAAAIAAGGGAGSAETQIVNFHTPDDPLTAGQSITRTTPPAGIQIEVDSGATNLMDEHGTGAFKMPVDSQDAAVQGART